MQTKIQNLTATRPTYEKGIDPFMLGRFTNLVQKRDAQHEFDFVRMLRSIRDYNPDVSKAVDNVITLCNPGYTISVYKYNSGKTPTPDNIGQQIVNRFAARCFSEYSGAYDFVEGGDKNFPGLNAFINMCHLVAFTQGAFAAEVQLTETLDDIVDVYPVDPEFISFVRDENTNTWVPGVGLTGYGGVATNTVGNFIKLNPTLFRYIPKDPDVDQPQGRSPLMSALDIVFFQQQVMRDLQAIAHQSNVPRIDIKVIEETVNNVLSQTHPELLGMGQEENRDIFLNSYLADIQTMVENLEPDDAFIHWDSAEVQYVSPKPTAISVSELTAAIDKAIVSATKQLPVLLGRNEGATTTHATVQWQVYILQIRAFQNISHALVTWLLNLLLRVNGRNSYVVFEYNRHKTTDDFIDAQALNMNANTYKLMREQGWIDNDEAAMKMTNHVAVGDPIVVQASAPTGRPGQAPPTVSDASKKAASS